MHFCPYFEKYLLKSLDIWLTHGIIGDVQDDIRKLTLVKVKVIQTKVKCSKRAIFSIKVHRFLGSFEAISVISRVILICNNFIFYRSSCLLEDDSNILNGCHGNR